MVVDADGLIKLIKLGKSGALIALARAHEVLVPVAVYEEAVVRGKKALHEDAFELGAVLESLEIEPAEDGKAPGSERMLEDAGGAFGAGELAALRLYETSSADAIVSDDRTFASFLVRRGIPAFAAAETLVVLVESGRLGASEGAECLERLREYTRAPVFESALASMRTATSGSGGEGVSGDGEGNEREREREESKDDD